MYERVASRRVLVAASMASVFALAGPSAFGQSKKIEWRESLASAMEESATTGRPVFADFGASW